MKNPKFLGNKLYVLIVALAITQCFKHEWIFTNYQYYINNKIKIIYL